MSRAERVQADWEETEDQPFIKALYLMDLAASCLHCNSIASINNLSCKGLTGTTSNCGHTHTHTLGWLPWQLLHSLVRNIKSLKLIVHLSSEKNEKNKATVARKLHSWRCSMVLLLCSAVVRRYSSDDRQQSPSGVVSHSFHSSTEPLTQTLLVISFSRLLLGLIVLPQVWSV